MANFESAISVEHYELDFTTSTGSGSLLLHFEANDSGYTNPDATIQGIRDHLASLPGHVSSNLRKTGISYQTL